MTHLRIELNGITEDVSSSVISKLYEIVHAGVDASSNLQGRLHCPISYRAYVNYLTTEYPDLYISVDDYAIPFEDPNMVTYLNSIGVGSNGTVTEALAAAATIVANRANTEVTKFNELKYFTNITSSRGGWTGAASGYTRFCLWTALEEIDISNFTSLGHVSGSAYEDTFIGCTALKTVTASDKLTHIGWNAFCDCTNLEHITGLSGTIQISDSAFYNCSKLPDEDIANVEFEPAYLGDIIRGEEAFMGTNLTEITLSSNTTKIPSKMFLNCSNLETVNRLGSNITSYDSQCFQGCTKFTGPIDFTNVTYIGASAFKGCKALQISLNCTSLTLLGAWSFLNCEKLSLVSSLGLMTYISESSFEGCKGLTSVNLPSLVTALYDYSFENCTNLSTINLPSSITTIGKQVFRNTKISNIIDLPNLTTLRSSAFSGCINITSVTDLGSITNIEGDTFSGCTNLTSITIPSTCTTIGPRAFLGCTSLTSADLSSITDLGQEAFSRCTLLSSLNRTTFSGITRLHAAVFRDCPALTGELSFPDVTELIHENGIRGVQFLGCANLTKISLGHLATLNLGWTTSSDAPFKNCTNLKIVNLGDSLTTLGPYNFTGCSNLKAVVINTTTVPSITYSGNNSFSADIYNIFWTDNVTVYVPDAALNDYKSAAQWSNFQNNIKGMSEYNEASILAS